MDFNSSSLSKCADQNQRNGENDPNITFLPFDSFYKLCLSLNKKHAEAHESKSELQSFYSGMRPEGAVSCMSSCDSLSTATS